MIQETYLKVYFQTNSVFDEEWDLIPSRHRWAVEKWPGLMSDLNNSISVFDKGPGGYYKTHFWTTGQVFPEDIFEKTDKFLDWWNEVVKIYKSWLERQNSMEK